MQLRKFWISALVFGSITLTAQLAYGQTYYVQSGDSIYNIAARYGTTAAALQQANHLSTAVIYPGQALQIASGGASPAGSSSYIVRSGDTLFLLAQRYGVSVDSLKRANNLSGSDLVTGTRITIPASSSTGTAATYRVQSGDTLYLIAQKYGTTVAALQSANGINGGSLLVGQTLTIPAAGISPAPATVSYTVKNGDSLFLIAQRYGISIDAIRQANNLAGANITPGQTLRIPNGSTGGSSGVATTSLNQSDTDLLARLVSAESDGEPFTGQVAVAATILNRLRDPRYPKSVSGIIYEIDNGCYQYSPVLDGRINQPASPSAYQAVQSALGGWDPSNGGNGFYNPSKTTSQWVRSQPVTAVIGNHVFFGY